MIFDRFENRGNLVAIFKRKISVLHWIHGRIKSENEVAYNEESLSDFIENNRKSDINVDDLIPVLIELRQRNRKTQ